MHPVMNVLYDEHDRIIDAIEVARMSSQLIVDDPVAYRDVVEALVAFFREYGDAFHHQKEEHILFPAMAQKNEALAEGILAEFIDHHEMFRGYLRQIEELYRASEWQQCQDILEKYCHALLDHIAAEDDEIFPMAESLFNESELDNLGFRFTDADRALGLEKKTTLEQWIDNPTE